MSNVTSHYNGECQQGCLPTCEFVEFVKHLDSIVTDPGNACLVPDFFNAIQDGDELESIKLSQSLKQACASTVQKYMGMEGQGGYPPSYQNVTPLDARGLVH